MKSLLLTSLICILASCVALLAASAMTVVPSAEVGRRQMTWLVSILLVTWLCPAAWAGVRLGSGRAPLPVERTLAAILVVVGILYSLAIVVVAVG